MTKLRSDIVHKLKTAIGEDDWSPSHVYNTTHRVLTECFRPVTSRPRRNPVPALCQPLSFFITSDSIVDVESWLFVVDVATPTQKVHAFLSRYIARRFTSSQVTRFVTCVLDVSRLAPEEVLQSRNAHFAALLRTVSDFPLLLIPEATFFVQHALRGDWPGDDVVSLITGCQGGVPTYVASILDYHRLTFYLTKTRLSHLIASQYNVDVAFPRSLHEYKHVLNQFLTVTHVREVGELVHKFSGVDPTDVVWRCAQTLGRFLPESALTSLLKQLDRQRDTIKNDEDVRLVISSSIGDAPKALRDGIADVILECCEGCDFSQALSSFLMEAQLERHAFGAELAPLYVPLMSAIYTKDTLKMIYAATIKPELQSLATSEGRRVFLLKEFSKQVEARESVLEMIWVVESCWDSGVGPSRASNVLSQQHGGLGWGPLIECMKTIVRVGDTHATILEMVEESR